MSNNLGSSDHRVDESLQFGPIITAPDTTSTRLSRILNYSYLIDLAVFPAVWEQGGGAELSLNLSAKAALLMVCMAALFKCLIVQQDVPKIGLGLIAIKRSKVKVVANLLASSVAITGVVLFGLSIKLVPFIILGTLILKAAGIFESILPPLDATPVLQLNAASKALVLIEFFPWFFSRAALIPVIVDSGRFENGCAMALIIGFLSAQFALRPGAERFTERCFKCHRLVHKIIILAFGSCADCKRFELGKKRT